MPKKSFSKTGEKCRVTFELPGQTEAKKVMLVGEFNDWDEKATPMTKRKDGKFSITVSLPKGTYRYRYLVDGKVWENDWDADGYMQNSFGTEDSVITI